MDPRSTLTLVTMITAASIPGCYSTWDIRPDSLLYLDGFGIPKPPRPPQPPRVVEQEIPGYPGRTRRVVLPPEEEPEEIVAPPLLVANDGERVEFTNDTSLFFRRKDGLKTSAKLASARVNGQLVEAIEKETGKPFVVDVPHLAAVQATKLSPGKTALATIGILVPVAGCVWGLMLLNALGANSGRPLRISGHASPICAPLMVDRPMRRRMRCTDDATRMHLFAHWAQEASTECASIPAFLALARDLKAAGAPQGLVDAALRAAREEATHTELCTALANDHTEASIAAVAPPTPANTDAEPESLLERLVLEAFWDGCVAEGAAASMARRNAMAATDERTRLALQTIARDEQGHADLAKQIIAYGLSVGGCRVAQALMESFERRRAAEEARLDQDDEVDDPQIDMGHAGRYGLVGRDVTRTARIEAWEKSVAMLAKGCA